MNNHCLCDKLTLNPLCPFTKPRSVLIPQCLCGTFNFSTDCPYASEKDLKAAIWQAEAHKQIVLAERKAAKIFTKAARSLAKHSKKFI